MRARVQISPADVGERVTVRSRIDEPGQPPLTDTVGVLERWQAGVLEIRRRDGELARVAEKDVVAGRRVRAADQGPGRP